LGKLFIGRLFPINLLVYWKGTREGWISLVIGKPNLGGLGKGREEIWQLNQNFI